MLESRFTFAIETMGCKANVTDSQAIESELRRLGGRAVSQGEADVYVLNTCTVTDQADRDAEAVLRRKGGRLTVVTGCMAEVSPDRAAVARDTQTVVIRNSGKNLLASTVEEWLAGTLREQRRVVHGERAGWHGRIEVASGAALDVESERRTRVFLKVQDGCDQFCSYCIIPTARGRSRSLPSDQVIREVALLVERGAKEIVLTAIHAADYRDRGTDFTALVARTLGETKVPRLRLTSLDPAEITPGILDLMAQEPRLCPHLHVSLQSASTRVLHAMKRGYDQYRARECLAAIAEKVPHAFVGMDVIAGFPGETGEEFEETMEFLRATPWSKLHVFPFSMRKGTAAARLVAEGLAVPAGEVKARAKAMRDLSARRMEEQLRKRMGGVMEIVVEGKAVEYRGRRCSQGYSRSYQRVIVPGAHGTNSFLRARVVGVDARIEALLGERI
ncbi:MAG: MiaB/RimO family radical SAM methylthiotransferase [Bdellovibrionales bacterium]|nr:MiaB/RimO family radical SAM methylthiotransferase [Bdellovibrionales bacterium]